MSNYMCFILGATYTQQLFQTITLWHRKAIIIIDKKLDSNQKLKMIQTKL